MTNKRKTKVAYVLAYRDPGYVRTRALLSGLTLASSVQLSTAINRIKNPLRYLETIIKLIWLRIRVHPDVYLLGFRGHEFLLPVRILTWPKPLIYDEFFDPLAWIFDEHNKLRRDSIIGRLIAWYYHLPIKSAHIIIDTSNNARNSERSHNLPANSITTIPVSTDESVFKPIEGHDYESSQDLQLFFYTNGQKLHGTEYILQAIQKVEGVRLHIVGGGPKTKHLIDKYSVHDKVTFEEWIDFEKLPVAIAEADVCLAGPFGGSGQAKRVVTGKTFQFLAMGKPTIVGENADAELFHHRKNSIVVEQASSDVIAQELEWLKMNRDKLENIGAEGRATYVENYSNQVISKKLTDLIDSISSPE